MSRIDRSTDVRAALRSRQRGFLLNPFRFGAGGGGGSDPYFSNVSLLLHMDGSNGSTTFTDNSPSPKTVTVNGNAQISTAQSKFGGASGLFDGSGDYLAVPASTDFDFGTGAFTIEMWARHIDLVNRGLVHFTTGSLPSATTGIAIGYDGTANRYTVYAGGSARQFIFTPTVGVFYHVALVRLSSSVRLYIDGTQIGSSFADATNYSSFNRPFIGAYYSTGFTFNGHLDDIRITKGVARYTANFTPPTAAFPDS